MQQEEYIIKNPNFDLQIDLLDVDEFSLGTGECSIRIPNDGLVNNRISIRKCVDGLLLDVSQCKSEFLVNEKACRESSVVVRNRDFFSLEGYYFLYLNDMLYTSNDGSRTSIISCSTVAYQTNHLEYPKFVKNTRQLYVAPSESIEILDPKPLSAPPEKNILKSLIPSLVSLVLVIVFRGVLRGNSSGGGMNTFVFYSIGMMLMGIGGSILTYISDGRKYEKEKAERETKYLEYIAEQEEKIIELRNKEHEIAWTKNASIVEDIERVANFDARLFEKKKEHDDYLEVYLGEGVLETKCPVKFKAKDFMDTQDYLMDYPQSVHDRYEYIIKRSAS